MANKWNNSGYSFKDKVSELQKKKKQIEEKNGDVLSKESIVHEFEKDIKDNIEKDDILLRSIERREILNKYYNLKTNMFAFSELEIEELGRSLVDWADMDEKNFIIKSFFSKRMIPDSIVKDFISKNTFFARCYEIACDRCESKLVDDSLMVGSRVKGNMAQFVLGNNSVAQANNDDVNEKLKHSKELIEFREKLGNASIGDLEKFLLPKP